MSESNRSQCTRFEEELGQSFLRERSPILSDQLERHLDRCPSCREYHRRIVRDDRTDHWAAIAESREEWTREDEFRRRFFALLEAHPQGPDSKRKHAEKSLEDSARRIAALATKLRKSHPPPSSRTFLRTLRRVLPRFVAALFLTSGIGREVQDHLEPLVLNEEKTKNALFSELSTLVNNQGFRPPLEDHLQERLFRSGIAAFTNPRFLSSLFPQSLTLISSGRDFLYSAKGFSSFVKTYRSTTSLERKKNLLTRLQVVPRDESIQARVVDFLCSVLEHSKEYDVVAIASKMLVRHPDPKGRASKSYARAFLESAPPSKWPHQPGPVITDVLIHLVKLDSPPTPELLNHLQQLEPEHRILVNLLARRTNRSRNGRECPKLADEVTYYVGVGIGASHRKYERQVLDSIEINYESVDRSCPEFSSALEDAAVRIAALRETSSKADVFARDRAVEVLMRFGGPTHLLDSFPWLDEYEKEKALKKLLLVRSEEVRTSFSELVTNSKSRGFAARSLKEITSVFPWLFRDEELPFWIEQAHRLIENPPVKNINSNPYPTGLTGFRILRNLLDRSTPSVRKDSCNDLDDLKERTDGRLKCEIIVYLSNLEWKYRLPSYVTQEDCDYVRSTLDQSPAGKDFEAQCILLLNALRDLPWSHERILDVRRDMISKILQKWQSSSRQLKVATLQDLVRCDDPETRRQLELSSVQHEIDRAYPLYPKWLAALLNYTWRPETGLAEIRDLLRMNHDSRIRFLDKYRSIWDPLGVLLAPDPHEVGPPWVDGFRKFILSLDSSALTERGMPGPGPSVWQDRDRGRMSALDFAEKTWKSDFTEEYDRLALNLLLSYGSEIDEDFVERTRGHLGLELARTLDEVQREWKRNPSGFSSEEGSLIEDPLLRESYLRGRWLNEVQLYYRAAIR